LKTWGTQRLEVTLRILAESGLGDVILHTSSVFERVLWEPINKGDQLKINKKAPAETDGQWAYALVEKGLEETT